MCVYVSSDRHIYIHIYTYMYANVYIYILYFYVCLCVHTTSFPVLKVSANVC